MGRILLAGVLVVFGGLFGKKGRALAQEPVQDCPQSASPTGNVIPALLTKKVNPKYPTADKMNFAEGNAAVAGEVVMDVVIASDGSVRDIKVTHGLPQLIGSAIHAVSQWQYQPARINGVGVACKAKIQVSFNTNAGPASAATANTANNSVPGVTQPFAAPGVRPALPPPPEGVSRISGRVMATMLQKRVEPVYPAEAIALDARGEVVLLATITKTGEVGDVQVVAGPERFQDAAAAAVKQWHYNPYTIDGQPVDVQTTILLSFVPPAR